MKIGVMSDTHDNVWALSEAIQAVTGCQAVLHCGDLISPFVIRQLGDGLSDAAVHIVWGNNDGDLHHLTRTADKYQNVVLHGALAEITLDGIRVAINHYPEIARPLAESGRYDLVAYGHDHMAHEERVVECLLINPGEVMGFKGERTVAVIETPEMEVEFVRIGSGM